MGRRTLLYLICCFCLVFIHVNTFGATYYAKVNNGNWNSNTSWSLGSYGGASPGAGVYPGTAANDVVIISNYTIVANVTPANALTSITIDQSNGSTNDGKLKISTAGITITTGTLTMTNNNVNTNVSLEVSSSARLTVTGNVNITRVTTDDKDRLMQVYLANTAVMTVGGNFNYTYNQAKDNTSQEDIRLDNTSQLNITGSLNIVHGEANGNDNDFNFILNNTPVVTCAAFNVTQQNSNDNDDILFDFNGGTFTASGAAACAVNATCSSSNTMRFDIDGTTVNMNGGFTASAAGGGTGDFLIYMNQNSTAVASAFNVTGNFTATHSGSGDNFEIKVSKAGAATTSTFAVSGNYSFTHSGGDDYYFEGHTNSVINIGGNYSVNFTSTDSDDGYYNFDGGTISITGTMTIDHTGGSSSDEKQNITISGGTLNAANVVLNNNVGGSTSDADNITWNVTSGAANVSGNFTGSMTGGNLIYIKLDGGASAITGNVSFSNTSGDDIQWDVNGGVNTVGGNFTVTHGGGDDILYSGSAGSMSITGNYSITHTAGDDITFAVSGGTFSCNNYTITHTSSDGDVGNYSFTGGTATMSGTFTINNNSGSAGARDETQSVTVNGGTLNAGALVMNQNSGATSDIDDIQWDVKGASTLTVSGAVTLTLTNGRDIRFDVNANSTTVSVTGAFSMSHSGGNDMRLYMGNVGGSPTVTVGSLSMNDSGGGTTSLQTNNSSIFQSNGDVTLTALAASQVLIDLNGSSAFKLKGSFIRAATPNRFGKLTAGASTTVHYIGSANTQTLAGDAGSGGDAFSYSNVTLNNSFATSPQFLMTATEGNLTINNSSTLTFANGVVSSSYSGMLVVASGSSSTVGGVGTYNDGPMKKIGSTSFTFPLGDGIYWAKLGISSLGSSAATTEFVAQYFAVAAPNSGNKAAGVYAVSGAEYWVLDRYSDVGNNATAQVTLYWQSNTRSGITNTVAGLADVSTSHYWSTTSQWNDQGGAAAGGASGSITSTTALVNFGAAGTGSPVTFISKAGVSPLPVELTNLFAKPEGNKTITVEWNTASEKNNDKFIIERSNNAKDFTEIGTIKGNGSTSTAHNYSYIDLEPFSGTNYYRLRQVDFDGKTNISPMVNANITGTEKEIGLNIFPNPSADGNFNMELSGFNENVLIVVRDINGKEIYQKTYVNVQQNQVVTSSEFGSSLSAGVYIIIASSDNNILNKKLIVK